MPLSRPDTIPGVINYIWNKNPQSLLDVGCGFGGMGILFRQVMDVRWGRVKEDDWQTKINGIEINEDYGSDAWNVYNNVEIGDVRDIFPLMRDKYDVIFFGDVLEHFKKEDALDLIKIAKNLAKTVIITTPASFAGNEAEAERFNNPNEAHLCLLEECDLDGFKREQFANQNLFIYEN